MRPEISDELAAKIERQADGILEGPITADELSFERQLEIVFEAARERTGDGNDSIEADSETKQDSDHADGNDRVESLIDDRLT